MTIPKFNELFPYVLEELINGEELHIKEIKKRIKEKLELSEEEMNLLVPSGKVTYVNDRIGWACSYLKMAGLLETPKRGIYVLSKLGNEYFNKYGSNIELSQVKNLIDKNKPEVIEIKSEPSTIEEETPEDQIHNAIINFNAQLADDILTEISNMSPRFFEKLVLDLLYAIGYGAKSENAIIKTPYTNDDSIYSSNIFINKFGEVSDIFRRVSKTWTVKDASCEYKTGNEFHKFDFMGVKIVVAICGDLWFEDNIKRLMN